MRNQLDEQRQIWANQHVTDYTFRQQRLCFCGFIAPVEITVQGGAITKIVVVETGEELDVAQFTVYDTAEGLFALVEDALDRDAHTLQVTYDATFGYPSNITVDYRENVADDELQVLTSDLQPLP